MTHAMMLFMNLSETSGFGMWLFLSIGAVSLFVVFLPLVSWIQGQRKEREAFYKADTMRRIVESSSDSAKMALTLMQQEERLRRVKAREGLKVSGLINVALGLGLALMLYSLGGNGSPYLVGSIPGLIGVAMLVYVYLLAAPIE